MTRRGILWCLLLAAACAEGAEEGVVARVDDWRLHQREVADLLVLSQPFPLEVGAARELVRHWIAVAALARRASEPNGLGGDAAVRESTWLERREALLAADREDRLGSAVGSPGRDDFRSGRYRLLAHVLRRVGPETSGAERDLQRRTAERILADLLAGGSWEAAVARSEDSGTREAAGLLGVVGPGELPPELDAVAFRLAPGQVSSVTESGGGFHILYRPRWEDVEDLYGELLRTRLLEEADAASAEGLLARRRYSPEPGAVASLRALARDISAGLESDEVLASWEGGSLPARIVSRYLAALPEESRDEMIRADEPALAGFLEDVAVRELRLLDARVRGVALDPEVEEGLRRRHAEDVEEWRAALGIAAEGPVPRRAVDRYIERVASRQVPARALPPLFERWLLERVDWTLAESELEAAVLGARTMLAGASGGALVGGTTRPEQPSGAGPARDP